MIVRGIRNKTGFAPLTTFRSSLTSLPYLENFLDSGFQHRFGVCPWIFRAIVAGDIYSANNVSRMSCHRATFGIGERDERTVEKDFHKIGRLVALSRPKHRQHSNCLIRFVACVHLGISHKQITPCSPAKITTQSESAASDITTTATSRTLVFIPHLSTTSKSHPAPIWSRARSSRSFCP
jgi:hypothetical protein